MTNAPHRIALWLRRHCHGRVFAVAPAPGLKPRWTWPPSTVKKNHHQQKRQQQHQHHYYQHHQTHATTMNTSSHSRVRRCCCSSQEAATSPYDHAAARSAQLSTNTPPTTTTTSQPDGQHIQNLHHQHNLPRFHPIAPATATATAIAAEANTTSTAAQAFTTSTELVEQALRGYRSTEQNDSFVPPAELASLRRKMVHTPAAAQEKEEEAENQHDELRAAVTKKQNNISEELFDEQVALERKVMENALERYWKTAQDVSELGRGGQLRPAQKVILSWYEPLVHIIEAEQELIHQRRSKHAGWREYGPRIVILPAAELAIMTLNEIFNLVMSSPSTLGCKFSNAALAIGKAVMAQVNLLEQQERVRELARQTKAAGQTIDTDERRRRKDYIRKQRASLKLIDGQTSRKVLKQTWATVTQAKVGSALLGMALEACVLDICPETGLCHVLGGKPPAHAIAAGAEAAAGRKRKKAMWQAQSNYRQLGGTHNQGGEQLSLPFHGPVQRIRGFDHWLMWHHTMNGSKEELVRIGMIRAHPRFVDMLQATHSFYEYAAPKFYPMLVPPRPWTSPDRGGYLGVRTSIMRYKGSHQQMRALERADEAQLLPVFNALNSLGEVPWKVNRKVLEVIKLTWEAGGGVGDIPLVADEKVPDAPLPEPRAVSTVVSSVEPVEEEEEVVAGMEYDEEAVTHEDEGMYGYGCITEDVEHFNEGMGHVGMDGGGPAAPDIAASKTGHAYEHNEEEMKRWRRAAAQANKINAERYSLRCDFLNKLRQAEELVGRTIYFPHNIDFRGRAYPIPPHLNHIGSDMSRGILRFDEKVRLGEGGLRWLFIHLANVYGKDKMNFDKRHEWAVAHTSEILAVAADPMNERWWARGENVWQVLATCFELAEALQHPDGPEHFESSLPVHQDGSCNGLQHYAALGLDVSGGTSVNLTPGDKPADVYSAVCDIVNATLADHARDLSSSDRELAALLEGRVTRKIIKQTVMTSVYGVTYVGARRQIQNRLSETTNIEFDEDARDLHERRAAAYLARVTLASISSMFKNARNIMTWLSDCAELVCRYGNAPMAWVTPLGLPVMQPYRRPDKFKIRTWMQIVTLSLSNDRLPVNPVRQMTAFPPNFVHSLDATHMFLTALDCEKRGVCFSAVHDSYWTHAASMDVMAASLRTQFVELYSKPILEDLLVSLEARFPHIAFPPLPERGDLDVREVLKSDYFFA